MAKIRQFVREINSISFKLHDKGFDTSNIVSKDSFILYVHACNNDGTCKTVATLYIFEVFGKTNVEVSKLEDFVAFLNKHDIPLGKYLTLCVDMLATHNKELTYMEI